MENKLTIKDSAISFISTFILCQLGCLIFAVLGLVVAQLYGISSSGFYSFLNTCLGCFILGVVMDLIIIACFFFFNKNKDNKIISKPSAKKIAIYIGVAVLCYLLLYPVVATVGKLIYLFYPQSNLTYPLTTKNYFLSLISMAIMPAIAEELLFRGLIFKGLQKGGNRFAIIVSSVMFSLYHLSLEQTIYPFLTGLVFAVIMCYENNIIYCMALHFTNNFITLTLEYFKISLSFEHWSYYIIAIICFAIFTTLICLAIKKLNKNSKKSEINLENKLYLAIILIIMIILWSAVQLSTIF